MTDTTTISSSFIETTSDQLRNTVFSDINLTTRQFHVFNMLANGYTDQQMAETLGTSASNVKKHIRSAITKLGCNARVDLRTIYLNRVVSYQIGILLDLKSKSY